MFIVGMAQQSRPEVWSLGQIEGTLHFVMGQSQCLGLRLRLVETTHVNDWKREPLPSGDHLHRISPDDRKGRP